MFSPFWSKKPRRIRHLAPPVPAIGPDTEPSPPLTPEAALAALEDCALAAEEAEAFGFNTLRRQIIALRRFAPCLHGDHQITADYLAVLDHAAQITHDCQRASGQALAAQGAKIKAMLRQPPRKAWSMQPDYTSGGRG